MAHKGRLAGFSEGGARTHVKRPKDSGISSVWSSGLKRRLYKNQCRHRQASFWLPLLASLVIFSFLLRLTTFCKSEWKRGGIFDGFENRAAAVNVPRRLAHDRSGREGHRNIDAQCRRLLGSSPQGITEPTSSGVRPSDDGDGSRLEEHPCSSPLQNAASSREDVVGSECTASDGGGRDEDLQESVQDRPTTTGPEHSNWRRHLLGNFSAMVESGSGQGLEVQSLSTTENGVRAGEHPDRSSSSGSESQEGTSVVTEDPGSFANRDVLEGPPSYATAMHESSVNGRRGLPPRGSQAFDDEPPSYLSVLLEDLDEMKHLITELSHGPEGPANVSPVSGVSSGENGHGPDAAVVALLSALEAQRSTPQQAGIRFPRLMAHIILALLVVGIPVMLVLMLILLPHMRNNSHTQQQTFMNNATANAA